MSGFTADWLDLREDADARARAPSVTAAANRWARARVAATGSPLRIVDLGCGTNANLRFLAPRLKVPQRWLLIDNDGALLAEAAKRAGHRRETTPSIAIRYARRDLARIGLAELAGGADLVTASALFDLVSGSWADALIAAVAEARAALLAVLTYDGRLDWAAADAFDARIRTLVNRHQRTDKGFGPALGPEAGRWLERRARGSGAEVISRRSDWRLDGDRTALQRVLLPGLAAAAGAIASAETQAITQWLTRRQEAVAADGATLRIGHRDLFAAW